MEKILMSLINPANDVRKSAEDEIDRSLSTDTQGFAIALLQVIETTNQKALTELALLTLHKTVLCKDENYRKLGNPSLMQIQNALFRMAFQNTVVFEFSGVHKRLAEITVQISVKENITKNHYSILFDAWNNANESTKLVIIYSLELLFEYSKLEDVIEQNSSKLNEILMTEFQSNDTKHKIACASMFTMMIGGIENETLLSNFKDHIKLLFELVVKVIQEQDEDRSIKLLSSIDDLISFHPKFLEQYSETFLFIVSEIIKTKEISEVVRISALNLLCTFVENLPICCKKSSHFDQVIIITLFKLLLENSSETLESELDFAEKDILTGAVTQKSISAAVVEVISKIGEFLGNKYTLTKFIPFIIEGLQSASWQAQNASLLILGMLIQGSKDNFENDFDKIMRMVLPFIKSSHKKVIFNCLTCIAFISVEFTPKIQAQYSHDIIPAIIELMNQEEVNELSIRAVSCLINYLRELITQEEHQDIFDKVLTGYTNSIALALIKLLERGTKTNNYKMIEEALCLISVISSLMKDQFLTHYDKFMLIIKTLLNSLSNGQLSHQQKNLKALLLDTIGFMLAACSSSSELINRDLPSILTFLDAQLTECTDDSPIAKSVIQFYTIFLENLKSNFTPLFEKAFELALRFSQIKVEIHFEEANKDQTEKKDHFESMEVDLKIFGGKKIFSINHVALELKIASLSLLSGLIKHFGQRLSEAQIKFLLEFNLNFFKEVHSSTIKTIALKMLSKLLKLVDFSSRIVYFELISTPVLTWIATFIPKQDTENLAYYLRKYLSILKCITDSRKRSYDPIPCSLPNIMSTLREIISNSIVLSNKKKTKVAKEFKNYDFKEIDVQDNFEEKMEGIVSVDQAIMELSGELIKMQDVGNLFTQLVNEVLAPHFSGLLTQTKFVSKAEILYSLCFFADLLEFCDEAMFNRYNANVLMGCMTKIQATCDDTDFLQTLAYLLGVSGYRVHVNCQPEILQGIMAALYQFLSSPVLSTEEGKDCKDNIMAALFKLFMKHCATLKPTADQSVEVLRFFSDNLPLLHDIEESKTLNHIMMMEYQNKNDFLQGSPEKMALTKKILAKIFEHGKMNNQNKITDSYTDLELSKLN